MGMRPVFTEEIEVNIVRDSVGDDLGLAHGSITWQIVAPRFVQSEFGDQLVSKTVGRVDTHTRDIAFHVPSSQQDRHNELAAQAVALFESLRSRGASWAEAERVLPDFVMVSFIVTMSPRHIVTHLVGSVEHSEPMRVINQGLWLTLIECVPTTAQSVLRLIPDGVFPASFGQEEIVEQEASHV